MSASKLQIWNMSLRILGAAKLTTLTDDVEAGRILTDIYDLLLDEVLAAHPWNFAIKRATLTELGGLITTWTAQGSTNVWQAALTTEPTSVEFNGTKGTEKTSIATLTAANQWYWTGSILYVYAESDPDALYTSPGIFAVIPEFEYDHAYSFPSDYLRIIKMVDSDADFVREEARLLTDEDEAKIQYIAQITDTTKFTPAFVTVLAQRLAAEMAYPITNSLQTADAMYKLYLEKLKIAKGIDAQEGSGQKLEDLSWEKARS